MAVPLACIFHVYAFIGPLHSYHALQHRRLVTARKHAVATAGRTTLTPLSHAGRKFSPSCCQRWSLHEYEKLTRSGWSRRWLVGAGCAIVDTSILLRGDWNWITQLNWIGMLWRNAFPSLVAAWHSPKREQRYHQRSHRPRAPSWSFIVIEAVPLKSPETYVWRMTRTAGASYVGFFS